MAAFWRVLSCLVLGVVLLDCPTAAAGFDCDQLYRISQNWQCRPKFPKMQDGKIIIMVQVSDGWVDFLENWLSFARPHLKSECMQLAVIADDQTTMDAVKLIDFKSTGLPVSLILANELKGGASKKKFIRSNTDDIDKLNLPTPYGSKKYKDDMSMRPQEISFFLRKGCPVFFSDIDVVWRGDVFQELVNQNAGKKEANMYGYDDFDDGSVDRGKELCGGFIYFNPTHWTMKVVNEWADKLAQEHDTNQGPLNEIIKKTGGGFDEVQFLSREKILNGKTAQLHWAQATVVHANWMIGKEKKKQFLKDRGLWHDGAELVRHRDDASRDSDVEVEVTDKLLDKAAAVAVESTGHTAPISHHA
mmetsp:Transcript_60043/g.106856  ORF Transcript_60043/g.106856 Transcript_60043/m.106856 type:complete len:360 (+) Transcript_60043:123-1202(+)